MTEFVEARDGVPFQLNGNDHAIYLRTTGLIIDMPEYSIASDFGEFVCDEWEVVRPYPTEGFDDEIEPDVVAVLVKRSKRYLTALAARDFIKDKDLHEEPGPVGLRGLFRSMGGTVIQPGGLSDRDAERFQGRTARIHGPGDITLFLQDGEDEARRRELMALVIAAQVLDQRQEGYEDSYNHGPLDLSLGDARRDHTEAHLFAAMLLVPQLDAAGAVDIASAEEAGAELEVDVCTVQDAHQLWDEITNPKLPRL